MKKTISNLALVTAIALTLIAGMVVVDMLCYNNGQGTLLTSSNVMILLEETRFVND